MIKNVDFKKQPPRLYENNSSYFLTFNTYMRNNILIAKGVPEILIDSLNFQSRSPDLRLMAHVILNDHLHLMIDCNDARRISMFLKRFKSYTAKQIKNLLGIDRKIIWQRGSYDHVIRDDEDFDNHLDYIHYNPVKHGFVKKPEEWKWSSYSNYVKKKIYEIGWGWDELDFKDDKGYTWGE
ncbi:MAG: transposase [Candidatus Dojkabacteria bacterium]|nr:transposase [Candidatus Dojkabacteria bacterium]